MPVIEVPGGGGSPGSAIVSGTLGIIPSLVADGITGPVARHVASFKRNTCFYSSPGTRLTYQKGVSWAGAGGPTATNSDGSDADGAANTSTGAETSASTQTSETHAYTAGQIQGRWGWYAWQRFKLPTTMTALTNRMFVVHAVSSGDEDYSAATPTMGNSTTTTSQATTFTFIIARWRQGTNGPNWVVRVGNGTNAEDAFDTGIAVATGTLYHFEFWADAVASKYYFRGNGGARQEIVSTLTPSFSSAALTTALQWVARNNAAVTGNGAIAFTSYSHGIYGA